MKPIFEMLGTEINQSVLILSIDNGFITIKYYKNDFISINIIT